ncbi:MAG: hypothetical protein M1816_003006 [Peltula sp. TS41687]|nr:MAG: hypothetical protein M1816_003006 [Peltula sp. TS41687]
MAAALNKRQQARNERTLQELIRIVAGNDRCADCQTRNPGWASWNLGVFLCMRCATIHRKLGTHISKVKSLAMDNWTNEQVENMKRTGNVACNRLYNPRNHKPPIPLDVDEIDMAMERFIRQKYERRTFQDASSSQSTMRHDSGSSGSDDPPPLPPKPEQRYWFGGRAASSTYPMSVHARNEYASRSFTIDPPNHVVRTSSPLRRNKQSQVFGASVGNGGEDMRTKLGRLKDLGFTDEGMNLNALKCSNGSLEKAVEINMAGGVDLARRSSSQVQDPTSDQAYASSNGTTVRNPIKELGSNNPFDPVRTQPQQSPMSNTTLRHQYPVVQGQTNGDSALPQHQSAHPVGITSDLYHIPPQLQPQPAQAQFFFNSHLPQALFPNATGGLTTHPQQEVLRRQAFTPPVPSIPQRQYLYGPSHPFHSNHINNNNPFLAQPSPLASTPQVAEASNHNPYSQAHLTAPVPLAAAIHTTPAPLLPAPTGRADKASIMALFNQPHLAPALPPPSLSNPTPSSGGGVAVSDSRTSSGTATIVPTNPPRTTTRSVSTPVPPLAGSRNPFSVRQETDSAVKVAAQAGGGLPPASSRMEAVRHASRESVDLASAAWANGRHSPDAFANLSARFVS